MLTAETVRLWKNTNSFMQKITHQYDDYYARTGAKIGDTLRIRLPVDYTVREGATASVQDTTEQQISLTMATQNGVDMSFNTVDLTLSIDDFASRYLMPAVNNLAGTVAVGVMSGAEGGVCNYVDNTASSAIITPSSTTFLTANAILDTNSAPTENRMIVTDPFTDARTAGALAGLFNPATEISRQYREGSMKNALGFSWMKDQTVLKHTSGTFTAGTVNGANQTGTTITTNAITGTLKAGDIISFASVNGVNRITKQSTGQVRQFVLLADVASGGTSISIYPALIPGSASYDAATGAGAAQYQTVTASPANSAAISLASPANTTYRKNIAFVPEAVTIATADLVMPDNVQAAREQYDGVSMRMVRQYMVGTDQEITRLDVLWGSLWIRPEWAVVVADAV